jgi:hypothetical protein
MFKQRYPMLADGFHEWRKAIGRKQPEGAHRGNVTVYEFRLDSRGLPQEPHEGLRFVRLSECPFDVNETLSLQCPDSPRMGPK